jgi:triacylglycerol lipase
MSRPPLPTAPLGDVVAPGDRWSLLVSRSVSGLAGEAVAAAVACGGPLRLVRATAPEPRDDLAHVPAPHGPAAPPVVLVHGLAASPRCWFALRRALRAAGRTVVSFDYSSRASSVEELADRLVTTVAELLTVTGAGKVHLIGHSLGGVIIAQALTGDRLAGRVDLVTTLGSPFGGSPWAALCPLGPPQVRALRRGSPLLRRLGGARPPEGVRWLAFVSTRDPIVPADRAVPAHGQVTQVSIDEAGHCGMLLDPGVIARIVAATAAPVDSVDPERYAA